MAGLVVAPSFLRSIRNQSYFTWARICCELIDNSFNAAASTVKLSWPGGNVFHCEDDGSGADDLTLFIGLGHRHEQSTNDIGEYGVGAKQAMIWLWGRSKVVSRTLNGCQEIEVDSWEDVADGLAELPSQGVASKRDGVGTTISCWGERSYPDRNRIIETLANTYTPALEAGKAIWLSRSGINRKLTPRRWPKCTKQETAQIEAAGRPVVVTMGIVADGVANPYVGGFSFERTYRVIKESSLGANGFAISRIAARIKLGKEWALSTNKDDFDDYNEDLAAAIYERFHDLMQEASQQAITFQDDEFLRALSEKIIDGCKADTRREKRNSEAESSVGTVEPQHTGRRRRNATNSTNAKGSVELESTIKRRRMGFCVEPYEDVDGKMGYYDRDGNRVRLNTNNPWLKDKLKNYCEDALLPVIYGLLAEWQSANRNASVPLFHTAMDDFSLQWGSVMARFAPGGSK